MADALHLDWETRGVLDLKKVGLHNYARDPNTDVWLAAYAFDDEDPQLWFPGQPCPPRIAEYVQAGGRVFAWNAPFEMELWREIAGPRYGWPDYDPSQFFCVMAQAFAMSLPGALDDAAIAVGASTLKDREGHNLMLRMARPRSKPGVRPIVWWTDPEKVARLGAYSQQDVRAERAVGKYLMPLSARERRVWLLDYKINQRGVQIDMASARAAIDMAERVKDECGATLATLTGGKVLAVSAVAALKEWMTEQGVSVDSIAKQAVQDLLDGTSEDFDDTLPPQVAKALQLRQEAGKASTAKFDKMVDNAGADGRLRHMYQYHGAGPGRWAGRKVQTHNLPRDMPKPETVERILALVRKGDWRAIDMIYGPPLTMLSKCLRSFFVAPDGRKIVSGDFANVEGRGQAWFAGEQWKLDAFVAADEKRGPGLYELAYSRMFHVPVESVKNPSEERQVGKVAELAFGYQGGVGSFHTMGKNYGVKVSDERANEFKEAWRDAHPAIAGVRNDKGYRRGGIWYAIQNAAIAAVASPGNKYTCGALGREATFLMVDAMLWCLLPSGRAICYPYPKILEGDYGLQLTYMCSPSAEDRKKSKIIWDEANHGRWARIGTYGGSLFNNIVQGFCRDFLADLLLWLDDAGAMIVMHTHDDSNIEVATALAEGARKAMQDRMRTPPEWAPGFPLHAACAVMDRYGK